MSIQDLPHLEALLNAAGALSLLVGWRAVRRGRIGLHKACMCAALAFSAAFLAAYLVFHFGGGVERRFDGAGLARTAYLAVLITHVVLAPLLLPFILRVFHLALKDRREAHRRLARVVLPLWLYVDLSGVLVWYVLYGSGP